MTTLKQLCVRYVVENRLDTDPDLSPVADALEDERCRQKRIAELLARFARSADITIWLQIQQVEGCPIAFRELTRITSHTESIGHVGWYPEDITDETELQQLRDYYEPFELERDIIRDSFEDPDQYAVDERAMYEYDIFMMNDQKPREPYD